MAVYRCDWCDLFFPEDVILTPTLPPHPKTGLSEPVNQCPECGCVEEFTNICDEKGCTSAAGCGWPSPDGYRRTCGKHWDKTV